MFPQGLFQDVSGFFVLVEIKHVFQHFAETGLRKFLQMLDNVDQLSGRVGVIKLVAVCQFPVKKIEIESHF